VGVYYYECRNQIVCVHTTVVSVEVQCHVVVVVVAVVVVVVVV